MSKSLVDPTLHTSDYRISAKEIAHLFVPILAASFTSHTSYNMSPPATRSPRSGVTRTRTGCWTCRARRKKCDETRPTCLACRSLNIQCEGYGVRLKWASRGRPCVTFRHAHLRKPKAGSPTIKNEPQGTPVSWPVSLADYTSEKDQVLLQYLGYDVFAGLSAFEREVLYDCKSDSSRSGVAVVDKGADADWGALRLFATPATETLPDPARFRESLIHCQHSKLMLLNSLTYQITFDPKHAQYADEYYGRSITAFRQALSDPVTFEEDMTPYAGILLCSISVSSVSCSS